jgi:Ca2+-transporting ATPase
MLPLLLGWAFTEIFTPVHVIFLELIMGPTCSIIYENEPMEPNTMNRPPRLMSTTFLSFRQLLTSMIQGLFITLACLGLGYYGIQQGHDHETVRTLIFITLLFANVFLTLVNRSFRYSVFTTIRYTNPLVPLMTGITLLFIAAMLKIAFLRQLFGLVDLSWSLLALTIGAAFLGTFWIEGLKKGAKKEP